MSSLVRRVVRKKKGAVPEKPPNGSLNLSPEQRRELLLRLTQTSAASKSRGSSGISTPARPSSGVVVNAGTASALSSHTEAAAGLEKEMTLRRIDEAEEQQQPFENSSHVNIAAPAATPAQAHFLEKARHSSDEQELPPNEPMPASASSFRDREPERRSRARSARTRADLAMSSEIRPNNGAELRPASASSYLDSARAASSRAMSPDRVDKMLKRLLKPTASISHKYGEQSARTEDGNGGGDGQNNAASASRPTTGRSTSRGPLSKADELIVNRLSTPTTLSLLRDRHYCLYCFEHPDRAFCKVCMDPEQKRKSSAQLSVDEVDKIVDRVNTPTVNFEVHWYHQQNLNQHAVAVDEADQSVNVEQNGRRSRPHSASSIVSSRGGRRRANSASPRRPGSGVSTNSGGSDQSQLSNQSSSHIWCRRAPPETTYTLYPENVQSMPLISGLERSASVFEVTERLSKPARVRPRSLYGKRLPLLEIPPTVHEEHEGGTARGSARPTSNKNLTEELSAMKESDLSESEREQRQWLRMIERQRQRIEKDPNYVWRRERPSSGLSVRSDEREDNATLERGSQSGGLLDN